MPCDEKDPKAIELTIDDLPDTRIMVPDITYGNIKRAILEHSMTTQASDIKKIKAFNKANEGRPLDTDIEDKGWCQFKCCLFLCPFLVFFVIFISILKFLVVWISINVVWEWLLIHRGERREKGVRASAGGGGEKVLRLVYHEIGK